MGLISFYAKKISLKYGIWDAGKGNKQTSTSPFASPVILVEKKDQTWRLRVNYRQLNDLTIKVNFQCQLLTNY